MVLFEYINSLHTGISFLLLGDGGGGFACASNNTEKTINGTSQHFPDSFEMFEGRIANILG